MKYKFAFLLLLCVVILNCNNVYATSGCCSHHGGVSGCSTSGRQICKDGTLSPSCTCTPPSVYGCTDKSAKNYNYLANKDDGSCTYYKNGCMDNSAKNYDPSAEVDDGSCTYYKNGCMDNSAKNYDSSAEVDDGSCTYYKNGCMDNSAKNYDPSAEVDDGSCTYLKKDSMDKIKKDYNSKTKVDNSTEEYELNTITIISIIWYISLGYNTAILTYTNYKKGSTTLIASKIHKVKNLVLKISLYIIYTVTIILGIIDLFTLILNFIKK